MEKSIKLLENENEEVKKRRDLILKLATDIEAMLIKENITLREFGAIVNYFNQKSDFLIPTLTIAEINRRSKQ